MSHRLYSLGVRKLTHQRIRSSAFLGTWKTIYPKLHLASKVPENPWPQELEWCSVLRWGLLFFPRDGVLESWLRMIGLVMLWTFFDIHRESHFDIMEKKKKKKKNWNWRHGLLHQAHFNPFHMMEWDDLERDIAGGHGRCGGGARDGWGCFLIQYKIFVPMQRIKASFNIPGKLWQWACFRSCWLWNTS